MEDNLSGKNNTKQKKSSRAVPPPEELRQKASVGMESVTPQGRVRFTKTAVLNMLYLIT